MALDDEILGGWSYFGGKNQNRTGAQGKWIAAKLPWAKQGRYIEPYCGMLGILLNRDKCAVEVANDLDEMIVNWWEVCRDRTDELLHKLSFTPFSESLYNRYKATSDEGDSLELAVKTSLLLSAGFNKTTTGGSFALDSVPRGRRSHKMDLMLKKLHKLADRLRSVQFLCRPAVKIFDRFAGYSDAVIYCDPPYFTADTSSYRVVRHDREETLERLRAARARIAISGYNDEWDELDWQRFEFDTYSSKASSVHAPYKRTEVLWTNYEPPPLQAAMEDPND